MTPLYLDHAAATPCRVEVWELMRGYAITDFGNPNCLHQAGRAARLAVDDARALILRLFQMQTHELIFTSGGTEANNLALRGVAAAYRHRGRHIITTRIEHDSILETCQALERQGSDVTYLPVDREGRISPQQIVAAIRGDTILVSVMHANNEIGTILPISELAAAAKQHKPDLLVHTDAIRTVGELNMDWPSMNVDLISFTAHKFCGPKGIGGLVVRNGVQLEALMTGGNQERRLRGGTESVPLIVGMAEALRLAVEDIDPNRERWQPVRDRLIHGLLSTIPDSRLNGSLVDRLPTNVNLSLLGVLGEDLVLELSRRGIYASSAAACGSGTLMPSHVLRAIGLTREAALGSVRLTLGRAAIGIDTDRVITEIAKAVALFRSTHYVPSNSSASWERRNRVETTDRDSPINFNAVTKE
jgi:cysteine desulfurase